MEDCTNIGKSMWPELLGANVEDARVTIEKQNPKVHTVMVTEGSFVDQTFDCLRVRVWVYKDAGVVSRVPKIG